MDRFAVPNRIKHYRSLLNISQSQLANDALSLDLIKSIETGRRKLTPQKASALVENLKIIALSKQISLNIDISEFLMPAKDYARNYCSKKIESLHNYFDNQELNKLLEIAEEYTLDDVKLEIYLKSAQHYFDLKNYDLSLELYKKVYEISIKINDIKDMLLSLIMIAANYKHLNDMENSILYYNKCFSIIIEKNINDNYILWRLYYHISFYYKRQGNLNSALCWIKKSISLDKLDSSSLYHSMLLKGNILLDMEDYTAALNMYMFLLENDTRFIDILYHNIAWIYYKLNKIDKSIEYFKKEIKILLKTNNPEITHPLMDMGNIYFDKNMYREAIVFEEHALDSCIKYNQPEYLIECSEKLLSLYIATNKLNKFNYYTLLFIKIYIKNRCNCINLSPYIYIVIKHLLNMKVKAQDT